MRNKKKQVLISLAVALAVSGISLACISSSPTAATQPVTKETRTPAVFQTTNMVVSPTEVNAGINAIVTARVTNAGSKVDDYVAMVRVDDASRPSLPAFLYSPKVSIAAGETQIVSVLLSRDTPGKYKVTWDNLSSELVVNPAEPGEQATAAVSGVTIAPDFTGVDVVTGNKISLGQFKGSVVLLNFVNYGCDPSLNNKVAAQLTAIRDLKKKRGDFVPISVFCGCCPPEVLRQFAKQNDLNWSWILDTDYYIIGKYNNYLRRFGYPTLVWIDKDQNIREATGYTSITALGDMIDKILKSY